MNEPLNTLLREAILAAQTSHQDPTKAAEKAAQAFAAGQKAYEQAIKLPAALAPESPAAP